MASIEDQETTRESEELEADDAQVRDLGGVKESVAAGQTAATLGVTEAPIGVTETKPEDLNGSPKASPKEGSKDGSNDTSTPKDASKKRKHDLDSDSSSPAPRARRAPAPASHSAKSPTLKYDDNDSGEEEEGELDEPPLPDGPPLPDEPPPQAAPEDDGWEPIWEPSTSAYYYFNRFTQATQWENPRVPEATAAAISAPERAPGTSGPTTTYFVNTAAKEDLHPAVANGYNPAIHGDYDPSADYAKFDKEDGTNNDASAAGNGAPGTASYEAIGQFNRFTGRFQHESISAENYNDDNKAKRQLSAFYNVDDAANSHNGKSLKAERSGKKLSAKEVREFKEKKKARKEEKKRAWLRD